jgi:hypothetical protein
MDSTYPNLDEVTTTWEETHADRTYTCVLSVDYLSAYMVVTSPPLRWISWCRTEEEAREDAKKWIASDHTNELKFINKEPL